MLNDIYKEGIKYKKCGVVLTGLEPKSGHTYDLLTDFEHIEKGMFNAGYGWYP